MNLKQKIRWVLLSFSVVPLTLFAWLHSTSFFAASHDSAQEQLAGIAAFTAVALNDTLVSATRDARALAATLWRHADDEAALADDLAQFVMHYPYFRELIWVRPSGVVAASTTRGNTGRRLEEVHGELGADFARALRQPGSLVVSDLDQMTPSERAALAGSAADAGKLSLKFLLRSDDPRGTARGVLVADVHGGALLALLREARRHIPGDHPILLVNVRGELLMSSGAGRLLEPHPQVAALGSRLAGAGDAQAGVLVGADVVGYAALPGLPGSGAGAWRVVVTAPLDLVTAPARRTLWLTSALMLGIIALGLLASLVMARRVDRRLGALVEGTRIMGQGDFGYRLPPQSADEIGALAESFNAMANEIEALLHVKERATREQQALAASLEARGAELESALARMERQNREITLRNELGDLLQSCISVDEAGAVIVRYAPRLFPHASGAVYLAASGGETLVAVAHWGEAAAAEALATTDCWALRRGKTHLVTEADATLLCPHVAGPLAGAGICVPLSAHGEALGLLHMVCPDACHSGEGPNPVPDSGAATMAEQEQLAEALAAQIGMALANLRLRESLHQQSIRDALTGLYNRRYLEVTLPRELSRALRGGRPLAVFMLDVDHFKKFNDSYGHDAGDAVLRALGGALQDSCRQADIACRFGGEEFTLILPDADEAAARDWAGRLMNRVRAMEVEANGQVLPKITISMGLALLPAHGDDPETLLQAADLALYDAKHAGRDRLAVSGEALHPSTLAGEGPGERGQGHDHPLPNPPPSKGRE